MGENSIYISYYLSRFNEEAIKNLGYQTWKQAFEDLSYKLKINKHTIKNWRDEFDPFHGHRAGWHQRPPRKLITYILAQFEQLEEFDVRQIVLEIISGNQIEIPIIDNSDDKEISNPIFILRGPTGKKAEDYFIEYHRIHNLPLEGEIIDTRDWGCGYHFQIKSGTDRHFIEVKGLADNQGGILLTNKEWKKAEEEGINYTICLVSNLSETPEITFINNPYLKLNRKKNFVQTIQIQWTVSNNELEIHK